MELHEMVYLDSDDPSCKQCTEALGFEFGYRRTVAWPCDAIIAEQDARKTFRKRLTVQYLPDKDLWVAQATTYDRTLSKVASTEAEVLEAVLDALGLDVTFQRLSSK